MQVPELVQCSYAPFPVQISLTVQTCNTASVPKWDDSDLILFQTKNSKAKEKKQKLKKKN